jgi:DNA (cytosine-5)-methyltransferase 1
MGNKDWTVVDLFSGCGGMSAGFARRDGFGIVGAVDAERGKPSGGSAKLGCNAAYAANVGVEPLAADLSTLEPEAVRDLAERGAGRTLDRGDLTVLSACTPCTDFTRTNPANHLTDKPRNSLVGRVGDHVEHLMPSFVVMENAREALNGNHAHHFATLAERLRGLGYSVSAEVHVLTRFGLAQRRERALVVAALARPALSVHDLWTGLRVDRRATTVRSALERLAEWSGGLDADVDDVSPGMGEAMAARIKATPHDGGSWRDLARDPATAHMLTGAQRARFDAGELGSHSDAYGRMHWDRPAPTIKRESAHLGNGRYAHPVADRLMTVREMATLQGFPFDYAFRGTSLSNRYRNVGDAVPPLVSYQVSAAVRWMITGERPSPQAFVLPDCSLRATDVLAA